MHAKSVDLKKVQVSPTAVVGAADSMAEAVETSVRPTNCPVAVVGVDCESSVVALVED